MHNSHESTRFVFNFKNEKLYVPYERAGLRVPGVRWMPLSFSVNRNEGTFFLKLTNSDHAFEHDHLCYEQFLVLDGKIKDCFGKEYSRGDFVALNPNAPLSSYCESEAVLLCALRAKAETSVQDAKFLKQTPFCENAKNSKSYTQFSAYGEPYPHVKWIPLTMNGDGIGSYFAAYEPPARTRPHEHQDYEEFLVFEGIFHDFDGALFNEGDFIVYPPGTRHSSYASEAALLYVLMSAPNRRLNFEDAKPFESPIVK
jgi:anti-sigma factor ChrR (cupin superfamily)